MLCFLIIIEIVRLQRDFSQAHRFQIKDLLIPLLPISFTQLRGINFMIIFVVDQIPI